MFQSFFRSFPVRSCRDLWTSWRTACSWSPPRWEAGSHRSCSRSRRRGGRSRRRCHGRSKWCKWLKWPGRCKCQRALRRTMVWICRGPKLHGGRSWAGCACSDARSRGRARRLMGQYRTRSPAKSSFLLLSGTTLEKVIRFCLSNETGRWLFCFWSLAGRRSFTTSVTKCAKCRLSLCRAKMKQGAMAEFLDVRHEKALKINQSWTHFVSAAR